MFLLKRIVLFVVLAVIFACFAVWLIASFTTSNLLKENPPAGSFVTVNNIRMHYVDSGARHENQPVIVLIHGAGVNLLDVYLPLGTLLAEKYRVIAIDRPGHGYSKRPKNGEILSSQSALIYGVLEQLEVDTPVMLGQSYGGALALNFALQYPDKLSALVLAAPVSNAWPKNVEGIYEQAAHPLIGPVLRRMVLPFYETTYQSRLYPEGFAPQTMPDGLYEKSSAALVFQPAAFKADAKDRIALHAQIKAQSSRYGSITVPVTILAGTEDKAVPLKTNAEVLASQITWAKLIILPGIGHPLHHAAKTEIIDAASGYLEQMHSSK